MFRSLPLLLLLAGAMAELPFYCRLRKPNCALRPNTRCCPASTTPEPSVSQPATTYYVAPTQKPAEDREIETGDDVDEAVLDEAIDKIEPKEIEEETKNDEELLETAPSQIREVIVDPPKELNQISAPSPDPVKTAPRFCLVLKYNCKSRSSHPCCRHPLPPRGQPLGVAATPTPPDKTKSRPSRPPRPQRPAAQSPRKTVHSRPSLQRTPRPRPTPGQESVTSAPSSLRTRRPTRRSLLRRSRPTRATRPTTARPRPSLRPRRERPVFLAGKAPVCRIINCARTPSHKCCREEEVTTTTEDTAIDSQATSTTPNSVIESEQEDEEEEMVVSHSASVSSVETKVVAVTNPRRRTRPTVETTTTEEGVTDMSYRELELATPSQESQVLDLVYETTVEPEEEQQEVIHIENTHMVFKEIKADTTLAPEEEEEEQDMKEKVDKDQPHESLQPPATDILYTPQSEVLPGPVNSLGQTTKLGHGGSEMFTPVHSEIFSPVHSEVYTPVHSEVDNPVHSEKFTPAHSEVFHPLHSKLNTPVHSEVENPVNSEMYTPVHSEVYTPVHIKISTPVFSEVHTPVNSQVDNPVNSDEHSVAQEINEEQLAVQDTWQEAPSPVFVPHPVFVPEPGEKERIREEVEHRIEQEERRQEQEEWRRQEHERRQQQEMVRQQEQRRKQEVEYWRSKVQEEERRREKEEQERKGWGSEELLKPAASYREARLVTLQEVLGEQEEQEGSHESVELPPRVRMECFRFDCLSSPWDPCCSRSKRQIQAQEDNSIHRDPLPGFRSPRLLPGWRVEATVTRVEKSIHWGED